MRPKKIYLNPKTIDGLKETDGEGKTMRVKAFPSKNDAEYIDLSQVWHDADEEPVHSPVDKYGCPIEDKLTEMLVITADNEIQAMYSTYEEEYEGDEEHYWIFHDNDANEYNPFFDEIKAWAYLQDVNPNYKK